MNNRNTRNVRQAAATAATNLSTQNAIYENSSNAYQSAATTEQQQQHVHQANSFMNLNNHIDGTTSGGGGGGGVEHETNFQRHQNNVSAAPSTNSNLTYQNLLNNNQMYHQTAQPTATLNNQVPPGVRANNYWDNFRR